MALEFDVTTDQKVVGISLSPTNSLGEPSSIEEGSLTTEVNGDGTVGNEDGNTVPELNAGSTAGDVVFLISADADLDVNGVQRISDTVTLHVSLAVHNATNLGLGSGSVVPK